MVKQLNLAGVEKTEDAAARIGRAAFAAILDARRGNTDFRLTEAALITALRPAVTKELPKAARLNGRNVLFDALAFGCGLLEPFTKSAAGQVAKALKEILEIDPAVTADELIHTATAVRRKYEGAGPMAVSTHWTSFYAARRPKKTEAKAPVGWLARLNDKFPDSTKAVGGAFEITKETDYEWSQLDESIRRELRT